MDDYELLKKIFIDKEKENIQLKEELNTLKAKFGISDISTSNNNLCHTHHEDQEITNRSYISNSNMTNPYNSFMHNEMQGREINKETEEEQHKDPSRTMKKNYNLNDPLNNHRHTDRLINLSFIKKQFFNNEPLSAMKTAKDLHMKHSSCTDLGKFAEEKTKASKTSDNKSEINEDVLSRQKPLFSSQLFSHRISKLLDSNRNNIQENLEREKSKNEEKNSKIWHNKYIHEIKEMQQNFEDFRVKTQMEIKILKKQKEEAIKEVNSLKESLEHFQEEQKEYTELLYQENKTLKMHLESVNLIKKGNQELQYQLECYKNELNAIKKKININESELPDFMRSGNNCEKCNRPENLQWNRNINNINYSPETCDDELIKCSQESADDHIYEFPLQLRIKGKVKKISASTGESKRKMNA